MIEISPDVCWKTLQMNEDPNRSYLMVADPILQLHIINSNGKSDVAKYLLNLTINGKTGWRLPTYLELQAIFGKSNWVRSYYCWYFSEYDFGRNTTVFSAAKSTIGKYTYADIKAIVIPVRDLSS